MLLKSTWNGYKIKKFATKGQLEDNIANGPAFSRVFLILSCAGLDLLDDILLLEALEGFYFRHHKLLVLLWHVLMHHLDGDFAAWLRVNTEFNFATGSWTKGSEHLEST